MSISRQSHFLRNRGDRRATPTGTVVPDNARRIADATRDDCSGRRFLGGHRDSSFQDSDADKAKTADPTDGDVITIKIENLKPGDGNAILFGCNPHSKRPSHTLEKLKGSMLAMLVLKR
jgi:hypothetical protein